MDDKTAAYVSFSHFLGIGPIKFQSIKKTFRSLEKAYSANLTDLTKAVGINIARQFIEFRKDLNINELSKKFKNKNIKVIHQENKLFPKKLLEISDPPICLYVKGDIENYEFDDKHISVLLSTKG